MISSYVPEIILTFRGEKRTSHTGSYTKVATKMIREVESPFEVIVTAGKAKTPD